MSSFKYNEAKYKELVLYIAETSVADPTFGAIKLNYILFFSDFLNYVHVGDPITGETYQNLEHGPTPRSILNIQNHLVEDGDAFIAPQESFSFTQKRLIARRTANLDLYFKASEIAVVDQVIALFWGKSATAISELSHQWSVGWQLANLGDNIPYFTVFIQPPKSVEGLSEDTICYAQQLAKDIRLIAS